MVNCGWIDGFNCGMVGEGFCGYGFLIREYVYYIFVKLFFYYVYFEFNGIFEYEEYISLKVINDLNEGYEIIIDFMIL